MKKKLLLLFTTAILSICPQIQAGDFAYDDGFIWYLAGRLASDMVSTIDFGSQRFNELAPDLQYQFFEDFKHIYHHQLISCSSPLPVISTIFKIKYVENLDTMTASNALATIGDLEHDYWPLIQKWGLKNKSDALKIWKSGQFSNLPKCSISGYDGPWKKTCQCPLKE